MERIVSLENLAEGAIAELFQLELEKCLKNICDPNTSAEKVREISIKVKITPTKNRDMATVEVGVSSKLQPQKPVSTALLIGASGGLVMATERTTPKQYELEMNAK